MTVGASEQIHWRTNHLIHQHVGDTDFGETDGHQSAIARQLGEVGGNERYREGRERAAGEVHHLAGCLP